METIVFFVFALLALASAIVVVAHKSPVYATMGLVVTLFSVAVLFVLLGAPFVAALQVLIYAGAIVVLFLFVIMLLNLQREESPHAGHRAQRWGAIAGAVVFAGMLVLAFDSSVPPPAPALTPGMVSLTGLSRDLFARYLLPFEIVGLLLLVAVVGATVVARKPPPEEAGEEPAPHAGEIAPRGEGAKA
jgi:NADH-quinone oxidoreductase subunit J